MNRRRRHAVMSANDSNKNKFKKASCDLSLIQKSCFLCCLTVQVILCCFCCFTFSLSVHKAHLSLFVILIWFDILYIFGIWWEIFWALPYAVSVNSYLFLYILIYRLDFLPRFPLESSTATELLLRHTFPTLGFTSANLVRNKCFFFSPPRFKCHTFPLHSVLCCVWECGEVFIVFVENDCMWRVKSAVSRQWQVSVCVRDSEKRTNSRTHGWYTEASDSWM